MTQQLVFVTGMGRSGSTFLATLLERASGVVSRHEVLADRHFARLSYYQPDHPFVAHTLRQKLNRLIEQGDGNSNIVVAVEPGLRYAVNTLSKLFPGSQYFHLVRSGREVVRSSYRRKAYTRRENSLPIVPHDEQVLANWDGWCRFRQLCWHWNDAVSRLLDQQLQIVKLEQLTRDYEYLRDRLLAPAGIPLTETDWQDMKSQRVNHSRFHIKNIFPGRDVRLEWTDERERQFQELCGRTMARLDYT